MARKKREAGDSAGYSWMDTYGDLVTLLLCFFVLLYASSDTSSRKQQTLAASLSGRVIPIAYPLDPGPANMEDPVQLPPDADLQIGAFREDRPTPIPNPTPSPSKSPGATPSPEEVEMAKVEEQMTELYRLIKSYIEQNELQDTVLAKKEGVAITVTFLDSIFFDSGKADIKPEGKATLDTLLPFIEQFQSIIESVRIEGHTDNRPISQGVFKNNWWLSIYRAGNVVEYMQSNSKIDPAKLSCDGWGEYHPIDTNDTPEGRAHNRRVELIINEKVSITPSK